MKIFLIILKKRNDGVCIKSFQEKEKTQNFPLCQIQSLPNPMIKRHGILMKIA